LQIDGISPSRSLARAVFAGLAMSIPLIGQAQEPVPTPASEEAIPEDYYRAELLIFERKIAPSDVNEHMTGREVGPTAQTEAILEAITQDGTVETTLELVPASELSLNVAAQRLERSGRYRVLMDAGWYQAFPPGYQGEPLRVAVGDWLARAGTREIEGTITIDRQRYLHVNVHLNHWQYDESAPIPELTEPATGAVDAAAMEEPPVEMDNIMADSHDLQTAETDIQSGFNGAPLELLTWIRETRRMRSEEIHLLDSPTVGVLVFFKKVEATE